MHAETAPRRRTASHPLDLLPLFRRWPPSLLRDLIYTGLWNALLAFLIVLASRFLNARPTSFWQDLYPALIISNIVGYLVHACLVAGDRLLNGWPLRAGPLAVLLYFVGVVGMCAMIGISLGTALIKGVSPLHYLANPSSMASLMRFAAVVAVIMFIIFVAGERRIARETLAAQQREQMANAAKLIAEARLRALQAQIEPHFLYNTLANVVGMIDTEPAQARRMLERFIDYLRASLAASRADSATLGSELDLAAAYLDVLAVRMGPRLRYQFDVGAGLRSLPMAPMLLQPVIENAVAHGLEPMVEGGQIVVRAERRDATLVIEVADSGAGLHDIPPKAGGGVGLGNLRARLRSMYGSGAQVQLLENATRGITVRIVLPLHDANLPAA
ncbi:histidine kinase [Massilia sp. PAMC28688]|uniref:sensor histidine kinase n=1 Tax=Massilia sp. PAMC28688 TaxID=2861283 RepID=UPI001C632600|nr:histidine kinase [Massilia sp. PAMC28688]QYF93396.1 histidine kinase [Massilia sp. PAMC28688]